MDRLFFSNIPQDTLLFNRFRLLRCLSAGHHSGVYLCRDESAPGRRMVVKVISHSSNDQSVIDRFREEIQIARSIKSMHVLRCDEWMSDDDFVAFTMEYVDGGTLADKLESKSKIAITEIVQILLQISAGVRAIHDAGIVHRDLKPENILIDRWGRIKICDFGIAANMTGPNSSDQDSIMGSMNYLSPEYIENGSFDARSDIYSIGVIGYELITGRFPFCGKDLFETLRLRVRFSPQAPRHFRADLPPILDRVILRALQRLPEKRYQSCDELMNALTLVTESLESQAEPNLLTRMANMMALGNRVTPSDAGSKQ